MENCQGYVQFESWILAFDVSKYRNRARAGIVITRPTGVESKYMCSLDLQCSNNLAEYQVLILGLKLLLSMDAKVIKILGDSHLVIK